MGSQATIQYTQSVQDYTGNRKPITMEQGEKSIWKDLDFLFVLFEHLDTLTK